MSIPVDLAELPEQISRLGASALLVSNSSDGPPHVASVIVAFDGDNLAVNAGRRTRVNAAANPSVTFVWPEVDGKHCLIVDGSALDTSLEPLLIAPKSAVLHRLAQPTDGA